MANVQEGVTGLGEQLRRETARARIAHTRLIADEQKAWGRYAHAVAEVLEQLETDLEEGKATLQAQRAARSAERKASVRPALDRARATLEELRVQGDLLAMEARDRVDPAREAAEEALIEVRSTVERLTEALHHRDDAPEK